RKELKNGRGLRLQDGFHNYFASGIHYRDRDGCLMHVEPNILFTVHQGAPFCRWSCERWQPTPKGRPFIMRLRHLTNGRDLTLSLRLVVLSKVTVNSNV